MTVRPRRPAHRKLSGDGVTVSGASLPGKGRGHADSEEEAGGQTRLDSNWKGRSAKGRNGSDEPMGNHQVHSEAALATILLRPLSHPCARVRRWRISSVPAWLIVLTGALFIGAFTLTACVDSAEPTVEVSRGQTPTPGVTPAAIPTIEVPWKRSQFWVSPGNAHPIDIRLNREETLEYNFTVGGDSFGGAIGALVDTAQGFTGPPDIRLKVTGPSGDVLWSAKTASSRNSITAETPGTYTLVFDNSYSQSTGKSIRLGP